MSRPRHPRKELEQLLRDAEARDWRVDKKKRYYRCLCPCGDCMESVHLTPSDPNYPVNKRNKMEKCPEWEQ